MTVKAKEVLVSGDVETLWSRLISVMDESASTMIRTAYSSTIRESKDLAVMLFDENGRSLAESAIASPSFLGTIPKTLNAFCAEFPKDTWMEGDLVITNDPWLGTGHLQDITMAAPIFFENNLIGFVAISAHGPDIGGRLYTALSTDIYEEGLRIPICKYAMAGKRDHTVKRFIVNNVRVPEKVIGDLEGMASCCHTASNQIIEILNEVGSKIYKEIGNLIIEKTNAFVKSEIRKIPNGRYKSVVNTSGIDEPLEIKCEVIIEDESIVVDYSGTSSSQPSGINVPLCYAYAHTVYPLKCLVAPNLPNNYGLIQPFTVNAPQGSILNPIFPAPVNARHLTGQFLSGAVFKAMAECLPSRVISESGVPRPQIVFSGINKKGEKFVEHIFLSSGLGGGDGFDGADVLCFPTNTANTPVEIFETLTNLKVLKKSIRLGSGGGGTFKGGCGQCFAVQNIGKSIVQVSLLADLSHRGATGLFGGGDGLPAEFILNGKKIPDKSIFDLKEKDILEIFSAGGGGYGSA